MRAVIYILIALAAYLISAVNPAIVLSRLIYHTDIRTQGSGNPGFTNFRRVFGARYAWFVFALDLLKAALVTCAGGVLFHLRGDPWQTGVAYAGVFALLGHAFPVFYGFHGGKAIAASFGALLGLVPHTGAVLVLAFWYILFSTLIAIHPNERRTVIAFGCTAFTCAAACLITRSFALLPGYLMIAAIPIYRNNEAPAPDNAEEAPLPQEKS